MINHYFLGLFVFLLSCSTNKQEEIVEESLSYDNIDGIIHRYLDANKIRLTEVDGYPVTYIRDNIQSIKGEQYIVVQIGHSFEHRYVTDQFIYIDSLNKKLYEYDLPNDSLVLWQTIGEK